MLGSGCGSGMVGTGFGSGVNSGDVGQLGLMVEPFAVAFVLPGKELRWALEDPLFSDLADQKSTREHLPFKHKIKVPTFFGNPNLPEASLVTHIMSKH